MRVIVRDTLKLQRQEHSDRRLELGLKRLQFAEEKFEDAKHSDTRRAMVGFLVAARQWPEVGAAMETAFRLFQERQEAEAEVNKAELNPIKVNQGDEFSEQEGVQIKLVDCSPSPVSSPPRRGTDLARFLVQESSTTSATVGGARTEGNLGQLKPIKDDQGDIFYSRREKTAVSDGGEKFSWGYASDGQPSEAWPARVRKRCRRCLPQSRDTAVQNCGGLAGGFVKLGDN